MTNDSVEKLSADAKIKTTVSKCPNCGGEAVFDAKSQKLHCPFCGSFFEIENENKVVENEIAGLLQSAKEWKEAEVYECKSCGAKEILSRNEVAKICPFCGTNNVVRSEDLAGLQPQGVVTFKIEKDEAGNIATTWAKKGFWAPRDFKRSATPENIHGVYNPVFTFDVETKSSYKGRLGEYYTTTNGKTTTTHVRYFNVSGDQNLNFDDFIVQASYTMPQYRITQISPFPTNGAPAYKPEYLRGYSACAYSKDGNVCWKQCKELMQVEIEKKILSRYKYDVKDYLQVNTAYYHPKYKYILLPVYVGNYTYRKKLFNFYINGSNGKIAGNRPVSFWKVFFAVMLAVILIAVIIFFSYTTD